MKYLYFLEEHAQLLGPTEGLSSSEIENIESEFQVNLPAAYKEFLSKYGKKSGNLLGSYLMEADRLKRNKASAVDASSDEMEGKTVEIKDSYFFFGQWQGYIFYFFDCSSNIDDPEVLILNDDPEIKKHAASFSDFIRTEGLQPILAAKNKK